MKRFCLFFVIAAIGVLIFAGNGSAVPFPNPDPTTLGDDLDSGLFIPFEEVVAFELFDGGVAFGVTGNEFGFFFADDPTNLITIFEPSDQGVDPTDVIAAINFLTGQVFDGDEGIEQNTFTPSTENIGFYLTLDPALSSFFGLPTTLFTVPSLNGGVDYAGTFPLLTNPAPSVLQDPVLLHQFMFDNPFNPGELLNLSQIATAGATPVPEPATLLLLGSGLAGLALFGRKRFKR